MLHQTLQHLAGQLTAGTDPTDAITQAETRLKRAGFSTIDYLELCHPETLEPVETTPCRLLAAAWLGTRLFDRSGEALFRRVTLVFLIVVGLVTLLV